MDKDERVKEVRKLLIKSHEYLSEAIYFLYKAAQIGKGFDEADKSLSEVKSILSNCELIMNDNLEGLLDILRDAITKVEVEDG